MKFSMCYQHVPGSLSLYLIYFALSFTFVICKSNPKEEITTYLFWECTKLDFYFLFFDDGPIKDAHHKRKENWTLWVPTTN
jgi:hypothetical protein